MEILVKINKKNLPISMTVLLIFTFELLATAQPTTTNRFWNMLTGIQQSTAAYTSSIRNFWTNLRPAYQYTTIGAGLLLTTAAIIHILRSKETPSNKSLGPIMERYISPLTEEEITSKLQELDTALDEMTSKLLEISKEMLKNIDQMSEQSIYTYKSSLANIELQVQNISRELSTLQPKITSNRKRHQTMSENQDLLNKLIVRSIDLPKEARILYRYCSDSLKQDLDEYLRERPFLNKDEIKKIEEKYTECKTEQKRIKEELFSIIKEASLFKPITVDL